MHIVNNVYTGKVHTKKRFNIYFCSNKYLEAGDGMAWDLTDNF